MACRDRGDRRLFVHSTDLDAQEAVIGNFGVFAAGAAPDAAELFRRVGMACASVPGACPTVMIDVDLDGAARDGMHVYGRVVSEGEVLASQQIDPCRTSGSVEPSSPDVISNGHVSPEPSEVGCSPLGVAARDVFKRMKKQEADDVRAAHNVARLRGAEFEVASFGRDVGERHTGPLDRASTRSGHRHRCDRMARREASSTFRPQLPAPGAERGPPRPVVSR